MTIISNKGPRSIHPFRVNHWPADPPLFAGIMPVLCSPGVHAIAMNIAKTRPLELIEIIQVTRIGAN